MRATTGKQPKNIPRYEQHPKNDRGIRKGAANRPLPDIPSLPESTLDYKGRKKKPGKSPAAARKRRSARLSTPFFSFFLGSQKFVLRKVKRYSGMEAKSRDRPAF
jgi:hypothetical protein